ncbi:MAG: tetratricopeptide repeat protein [Pyrinomonadaceae bacterium]
MKLIGRISYILILGLWLAGLAFAQQTKETAENYYKLGVEALERKNYNHAIEYFSIAIGVRPLYAEAYLQQSKARRFKRDWEGALSDAGMAIEINPEFGEAYFQRALILTERQKTDRTAATDEKTDRMILEDLDNSIRYFYKTTEVYLLRGDHKCERLKKCAEAVADYDEAFRLDPKETNILRKRALAKYRSGDMDGAAADERLVNERATLETGDPKKKPDPPPGVSLQSQSDKFAVSAAIAGADVEAHLKKADQFNREGKLKEAIAELTEAVKIQPDNPVLYSKRANLARLTSDADLVEKDVLKTVELRPADFEMREQAVHFLLGVERCRTALTVIDPFLAQNPTHAAAYYARARVKNCLEDFAGAMEDNDQAIALDPFNEMYKAGRANLLARQSKTEESVSAYEEVIRELEFKLSIAKNDGGSERIKPRLAQTYIARSRLFAKGGDLKAAFADLDRAVEVWPEMYTHQTRARAYKWQKMYGEALADYAEAIRLQPKNPGLYLERGDIYFLMEKYPQALADYEKAADSEGRIKEIADQKIRRTKEKLASNKQ